MTFYIWWYSQDEEKGFLKLSLTFNISCVFRAASSFSARILRSSWYCLQVMSGWMALHVKQLVLPHNWHRNSFTSSSYTHQPLQLIDLQWKLLAIALSAWASPRSKNLPYSSSVSNWNDWNILIFKFILHQLHLKNFFLQRKYLQITLSKQNCFIRTNTSFLVKFGWGLSSLYVKL